MDESIGQAVRLEVIAGMFRIVINSIGDMVGTLIVTFKEGMLDRSKLK